MRIRPLALVLGLAALAAVPPPAEAGGRRDTVRPASTPRIQPRVHGAPRHYGPRIHPRGHRRFHSGPVFFGHRHFHTLPVAYVAPPVYYAPHVVYAPPVTQLVYAAPLVAAAPAPGAAAPPVPPAPAAGAAPFGPRHIDPGAHAVDGDTFDAGGVRYRLNGIDAPELQEPLGAQARDRLQQLLDSGSAVAYPIATDVYGRVIADVLVNGVSVASLLRSEGYAKR